MSDTITPIATSQEYGKGLRNSRRRGIESDSALDEKLMLDMISSAYERHKKQYSSTPRTFTYDKLDGKHQKSSQDKDIDVKRSDEIRPAMQKMPSMPENEERVRSYSTNTPKKKLLKKGFVRPDTITPLIEEKRKLTKDSKSSKSAPVHSAATGAKSTPSAPIISINVEQDTQQPVDREVSTSYTESLDHMLKQQVENEKKYQKLCKFFRLLTIL
jgi:hypothetical protein